MIEEKISEKKEEISNLELEMQMYRDIKNILEKLKIEQEKINFHNQLKTNNMAKIKEYDFSIDTLQEENKELFLENFENKKLKKEKNESSFIFCVIILVLANILQFLFLKNTIVRFSILIILVSITATVIFSHIRSKKANEESIKSYNEKVKRKEIIKEKINLIENEIKTLEKSNEEIEKK